MFNWIYSLTMKNKTKTKKAACKSSGVFLSTEQILNIRLGSANDSAFLVLIIILLFARNVNRTDDITVAVVDIEKLRTSK